MQRVLAIAASLVVSVAAAQLGDFELVSSGLPTSDHLEAAYIRAIVAIGDEKWESAIGELQSIIEDEGDAYPAGKPARVPGSDDAAPNDNRRSWKQIASDVLSAMPEEGRKAYETRYDAVVAARLAASDQSNAVRTSIALTYRWTQAARAELLRLAAIEIDVNEAITARRLLKSIPTGLDPEFDRKAADRLAVAEAQIQSRQTGPVVDWLQSGGSSRGTALVASTPLSSDGAWTQPLIKDADVKGDVELLEQALSQATAAMSDVAGGRIPFRPAIEPIIVGPVAVVSDIGKARGYNVESGELLWESALPDRTYSYLTKRVQGRQDVTNAKRALWLLERVAADRTQGTLSSDGTRVFAIIDSGSDMLADIDSPESARHPLARSSHNRLVCFDARSGLIRWWIGGPRVGAFPMEMAGVFFLGPPTSVNGRLFVLGEEGRQIRLYELDSTTGAAIASQDLWNGSGTGVDELLQPTLGASPLAVGPILICPLRDSLVALDSLTHELLWIEERGGWNDVLQSSSSLARELASNGRPASVLMQRGRSAYPSTVVTNISVIDVAGADLVCHDLISGEVQWSTPRADIVWLESVTEDVVLVATTRGLAGYSTKDGSVLWQQQIPSLSGGGLVHQDANDRTLLTVPTQTGEIVTVDVHTGKIIARTSTRSGFALGTLVGTDGRTVSFTGRELVGFESVTNTPTDSLPDFASLNSEQRKQWLDLAAELLHRGRGEKTLEILEALKQSSPQDAAVESMLAAALLNSVDTNPDGAIAIVESLDIDLLPKATAIALRQLLIKHNQSIGDSFAEADQLIHAIALGATRETVALANNRQLSLQQSLIARLQNLVDELPGDDLITLRSRTSRYVADLSPEESGQLAGKLPDSLLEPASAVQVASWATPPARRENLLWDLINERADLAEEDLAKAAAELARIYANAGRSFDLAALQDRFETNPREDWKVLFESAPVSRLLRVSTPWVPGPINVRARSIDTSGRGLSSLKMLPGPNTSKSLNHWLAGPQHLDFLLLDPRGQTIESFDMFSRVSLSDRVIYVETRGHIAAMVRFGRFELVNVLEHPVRPLAAFNLTSSGDPLVSSFGFRQAGLKSTIGVDRMQRPIGTVGPLTATSVSYLQADRLTCVDIFNPNGTPLWTVDGVPPGCELFGDDDVIIARPPQSNELLAFNSIDGSTIEIGSLPEDVWGIGDSKNWSPGRPLVGRCILRQHTEDGQSTLSLFDLIAQQTLWSHPLSEAAVVQREDQLLLIASPTSGDIELVDVETGDPLGATKVRSLEEPEYTLHRAGDQAFVICGTAPTEVLRELGPSERHARPITSDMTLANGPVIAFDLKAKTVLWTHDVKDQRWSVDQPAGWPFLFFASNYVYPKEEGSNVVNSNLRVELIDKNTGETLWKDEKLDFATSLHWQPRRGGFPGTSIRFSSLTLDIRPEEPTKNDAPAGNSEPGEDSSEPDDDPDDQ